MRRVAFAVPGDLATPTGGYGYDRRMIAELQTLGWQVDVVGLREEGIEAGSARELTVDVPAAARHRDEDGPVMAEGGDNPPRHLQAVHPGEYQVQADHVGLPGEGDGEGLLPIGRAPDRVAPRLYQVHHHVQEVGVVLDYQDAP